MEPIIYKPGAYKSPSIYKGAGGIYNGRGVYDERFNYKSIKIGDNTYKYIKIGNIYWLAQPFKERVGDYKAPNNDINNIEKFGYLYKVSSLCDLQGNTYNIITDISNGFKIPTKYQLDDLINRITSAKDLFSKKYGGNNKFGLNLTPGGMYENNFAEFGAISHIFASYQTKYNSVYQCYLRVGGVFGYWENLKNDYFQVILCKDA